MTPLMQVRQLINDPYSVNSIHTDEEINQYLTMMGGDIYLTAALCLQQEMTDATRMTERINFGGYGTDESSVYKALQEASESFRRLSNIPTVNTSPVPTCGSYPDYLNGTW